MDEWLLRFARDNRVSVKVTVCGNDVEVQGFSTEFEGITTDTLVGPKADLHLLVGQMVGETMVLVAKHREEATDEHTRLSQELQEQEDRYLGPKPSYRCFVARHKDCEPDGPEAGCTCQHHDDLAYGYTEESDD